MAAAIAPIVIASAAAAQPAGQAAGQRPFNIPAQPLAAAILAFSQQSGAVVTAPARLTRLKLTRGVRGNLPPDAALRVLLEGSGLNYRSGGNQTYIIDDVARAIPAAMQAPPRGLDSPSVPVAAGGPPVDPPQPTPNEPAELVVTGTRLQSGSFTAPTPVTSVGAGQIAQRSSATAFEILRDIPSFRATSGPSANSTGAQSASKANLDLRGLGASRTLVLINGRRHVPDGTGNVFDSNLIPTSLIDRVDVVTGGASAAYGSDAVAGVVNFVLKNHFEGLRAEVRQGISQEGDNQEFNPSFAVGAAFLDDRLHLVLGGDATINKGTGTIFSRGWGQLEPGALSISNSAIPNRVALGLPANIISNFVETSAYNASGLITSGPLRGIAFADGGVPYPFQYGPINGGTEMIGGGNYYSVENPDQFLRAAYERAAILARAEYELGDTTSVFGQFQYGMLRTHGRSFGARVPNFNNYPVLITNPFLPQSIVDQMRAANITRFTYSATRHDDLGSIESANKTDSYQGDVGINGSLFGDWKWDAGAGYGSAAFKPFISNTPRTADFFHSAYVVRGADGAPTCGPVESDPYFLAQPAIVRTQLIANLSPNCVPYNIFGTNLQQNQGALAYFNSASAADFEFRQYTATANLSGEPVELPAGPISLAIGAEWRKDTLSSVNCADCQRGALMNQNYSLFRGKVNVKEVYGEASVPLLADMPFFHSLVANGAVRRTDYSTSGAVTTWKVGGTWDLDRALRLRGTRSHDIRAPNINELFNPGSEGNPNVINRANGASGFIKSNTVGNPALQPEIGDTYTFGAVFQPRWQWASGLRISADYYNIRIKGVIATLNVQDLLDDVLTNPGSVYQQYVERDGTALGVSRVNVPQLNLNALKTDGIDIEVDYTVPMEAMNLPGRLNLRALGTNIRSSRTITATTDIDQVQTAAAPKWSVNLLTTYSLEDFTISWQTRYTSKIKYSATLIGPDDPAYSVALPNSINRNIWPSALYFNGYLSYTIRKTDRQSLRVYANVDNVFDRKPPIVAISIAGSPYDLVGRAFKIGAQFNY